MKKITIREHRGFREWNNLVKLYEKKQINSVPVRQLFGRFQYLFQTKKGIVSIVQLFDMLEDKWYWKIGSFYKNTTKIKLIERFLTSEKAQKRAWELLK